MPTLMDEKHRALKTLTLVDGTVNDMEVEWLKGAIVAPIISGQLEDLWDQYWDELLVVAGQHNDRAFAWLGGLGHLQPTLNERWLSYWAAVV